MPASAPLSEEEWDLLCVSSPPWLLTATRFYERNWRVAAGGLVLLAIATLVVGRAGALASAFFFLACGARGISAAWSEADSNVRDMFRRRNLLLDRMAAASPQGGAHSAK